MNKKILTDSPIRHLNKNKKDIYRKDFLHASQWDLNEWRPLVRNLLNFVWIKEFLNFTSLLVHQLNPKKTNEIAFKITKVIYNYK